MSPRALRILSVVTLVSPHGEYGGPVRVAVNQAAALRARGHEVTLVGGQHGFEDGSVPTSLDGVPTVLMPAVTLVPGTGFAGLASPRLWRWVRRHVRDYDVVHVHAARDLVTLPVARIAARAGVPLVLQTHGMIDPSGNPLARPLDASLTRPVLRSAHRVLHLTGTERRGLVAVAGDGLRLAELPNGVPEAEEAPIPEAPRVLYLARLAPRKRPAVFVAAARELASAHPEAEFVLVGPDEGEGAAVREGIAQATAAGATVRWEGAAAPEATLELFRSASVYVLPSVDEPYPMSVLEAMSVGLPVVVTRTCGLAETVRRAGAGAVVDESTEDLVRAVDALLASPEEARRQGAAGRAYVREHLSMASIAAQLESVYLAGR